MEKFSWDLFLDEKITKAVSIQIPTQDITTFTKIYKTYKKIFYIRLQNITLHSYNNFLNKIEGAESHLL